MFAINMSLNQTDSTMTQKLLVSILAFNLISVTFTIKHVKQQNITTVQSMQVIIFKGNFNLCVFMLLTLLVAKYCRECLSPGPPLTVVPLTKSLTYFR